MAACSHLLSYVETRGKCLSKQWRLKYLGISIPTMIAARLRPESFRSQGLFLLPSDHRKIGLDHWTRPLDPWTLEYFLDHFLDHFLDYFLDHFSDHLITGEGWVGDIFASAGGGGVGRVTLSTAYLFIFSDHFIIYALTVFPYFRIKLS